MGIINIYFIFYLSYWLRLLLIICGDVEYSNIRGLHSNWDELAVAGSDYDVLVCAESKVSDRRHLSELLIPGFGCPKQRLWNSTPSAKGMAPYVREGCRASWSVLAMNPLYFVFAVG